MTEPKAFDLLQDPQRVDRLVMLAEAVENWKQKKLVPHAVDVLLQGLDAAAGRIEKQQRIIEPLLHASARHAPATWRTELIDKHLEIMDAEIMNALSIVGALSILEPHAYNDQEEAADSDGNHRRQDRRAHGNKSRKK